MNILSEPLRYFVRELWSPIYEFIKKLILNLSRILQL